MWIVGQRVFAEYEPELGLGLVVKVTGARLVEVLFAGAELSRQYAAQAAPLRRLRLNPGQRVQSKEGVKFTIREVHKRNGLFQYVGEGHTLWEYEIGALIDDSEDALSQFILGHWSEPKAFDLRRQSWFHVANALPPDLRGLVGPRVATLPHQLFIAHETSSRGYPRLLLSDEVGLGKTIEAGLLFSAMRALGRADRVLVVVPDALKHQWLAEMYRCFHEMFSVVDAERDDEEMSSQGTSAFQMNQRIICSLNFLAEDSERLEQALAEPWDLLIFDEAHHLKWSPEDPSPEWEVARRLCERTRGLLLLTATPEHHGMETKFGLLHLVDAERFSDFESFEDEAERMERVARLAGTIHEGDRSDASIAELRKRFPRDEDLQRQLQLFAKGGAPEPVLRALIDRHGTGRVLIRNRRSRLKGFSSRVFRPAPLPVPPALEEHLQSLNPETVEDETLLRLAAGRVQGSRSRAAKEMFEGRARWLVEHLKSLNGEKALLIVSKVEMVLLLEEWMRTQSAIRTAVFHEELEVVERDRQAAWFARADGAQILLCSEIGGEGRNFQFAHHLILFDLPLHPDLLEQRVGRLDRIGQTAPIQVHVPYFDGTLEEVFIRWYAEGLFSFEKAWNGGTAAIEAQLEPLVDVTRLFLPKAKGYSKRKAKLDRLLANTREHVAEMQEQQRHSVDLLVDLNSFDEERGRLLVERVRKVDSDPALRNYMESVFDYFGVETEEMDSEGTLKVGVHSLTFVENFPGLTAHGEKLVTFNRQHALSREELTFLTWDHPMVQGALGLVLEGKQGRASAADWKDAPVQAPFLLETLFVLQAVAPPHLELERDLPVQAWTVFVDPKGVRNDVPTVDASDLQTLAPKAFLEGIPNLRGLLTPRLEAAAAWVKTEADAVIKKASAALEARYREQAERLEQLARVNPLVSDEEIQALYKRLEQARTALKEATPRLDAIRLIIPK